MSQFGFRKAIVGVLLAQWASSVSADPGTALLNDISHRLHQPRVLRGQFSEKRTVPGLAEPIETSGDFLLVRGRGISWHVSAPREMDVLVTPGDVVVTRLGRPPVHYRGRPGSEPIPAQLIDQVFRGDLSALSSQFKSAGAVHGEHWDLVLTPLDANLAHYVGKIALAGDTLIESISVDAESGAHTAIAFSHLDASDRPLSAAEGARFE